MDDLKRTLEKIRQITTPIQEINDRLNQAIPPYIRKLNEALDPTIRNLHKALKAHQPFFDQMACTLIKMQEAAYRWQEARKSDVTEMAENGWYPNRFTFFYTPETEPESVDELMCMHVNADWEELAHKIIELCPDRKHILGFLFTGNDTEEKINALIDSGEIEANMFTNIFIEPFRLKNHHNAGISKSSLQPAACRQRARHQTETAYFMAIENI